MKIVKLEHFHADGGWDTYSFLKITTDEGITGWSEFNESRRKGMTALIHGLGAALIGEDPCAIARIDAALYARSRSTAGGLTSHAIAAIENACLDIRGKALGVPVYELLGGAVRERMPVYWSRCSPPCAKAQEKACGSSSISTSTTSPRGCGASPKRSSRSISCGSKWTCSSPRR